MTVMHSCDHHDVGGCVPDNRSRRRILEQLRAATALSDTFAELFHHVAYNTHDGRPIAYVPLEHAVPVMQQWLAWLQLAPTGDDWAEPSPPSDITIPTYPDDTERPPEGGRGSVVREETTDALPAGEVPGA